MHAYSLKNRLIVLALVLPAALVAGPAYAHGFGQRYDLPVPLWLYLTGAGTAVAFSFVVIGFFVRGTPGLHGYPRINLLESRAGRLLTHPAVLLPLQVASMALFAPVVVAGALGNQDPRFNIAPTAVWVVWWVGLAYVSALVGDLWALLNPWKILFSWAEALYRLALAGDELAFHWRYPERLGVWPGLLLFLAFAWAELVYPSSAVPNRIAAMAAVYSAITWAGMLAFGKHQGLRHGDAFTLVFGLLARFAPTEVLVRDTALCQSCSGECSDQGGTCVNCYECFERAAPGARALNLRPYAAGLLHSLKATPSFMALVVVMLSTVTFDGFTATPLWAKIVGNLYPLFTFLDGKALIAVNTLGLLTFPAIFLGVYLSFSAAMALTSGTSLPVTTLARTFIFSIVPIALAYHVAHYLSFLLIQGQVIIAQVSDPLGLGWNLLGTAGYKVNIGIINARYAWLTAVAVIVAGHIVAVYVAHVVAMRTLEDRKAALRSQYPMLALMVGYTMVSLWIIAQPIVETARKG